LTEALKPLLISSEAIADADSLLTLAVAAGRAAQPMVGSELENEVMCTLCHQLPQPVPVRVCRRGAEADQEKHDLGWSKQRTLDWLVQQYGEEVLAAPPKHGSTCWPG